MDKYKKEIMDNLKKDEKNKKKKLIHFFILGNLQGYIKALIKWTNALNQIQ